MEAHLNPKQLLQSLHTHLKKKNTRLKLKNSVDTLFDVNALENTKNPANATLKRKLRREAIVRSGNNSCKDCVHVFHVHN